MRQAEKVEESVKIYQAAEGFSESEARRKIAIGVQIERYRRISVDDLRFILEMLRADANAWSPYTRDLSLLFPLSQLLAVPSSMASELVRAMRAYLYENPAQYNDIVGRLAIKVAFRFANPAERTGLMAERAAATGLRRASYDYAYDQYRKGFPERRRKP